MKAVRIHTHGSPDVLTIEDVATPTPGPGQILLRVESAAVNYADLMRRRDDPYPFPTTLPFTPGGEVAGTVEGLGEGVDAPPVGTAVFALVGNDGSNGYAQYAVANAAQVIPIPPGLSSDEAAGIVVAGATALLTLTEVGELAAGETVLVEGAGGGVGSYAIQIAKLLGATVVAAASTSSKRDTALALGADHVVDYTQPDWVEQVRTLTTGRGVDVVLETAGGPIFDDALRVLAPFGRIVVAGMASGTPLHLDEATTRAFFYDPALNQSLRSFNVGLYFGLRPQTAIAALQTLIGYVATGRVKVPLSRTYPLAEAADAHRLIEDRQSTGKIILKPWP
jgi:NADPH:quinone reductase-like Zn-dependent oxidoreductase